MTGHRRIGSIGQPDLLETQPPLSGRHRVARHRWKKSFHQRRIHVRRGQRGGNGAANQARAAAQQRDRVFFLCGVAEQRLFSEPRLVPEAVQLPGIDAMSRRFEPLLEKSRKREIHVVAAEQDVLTDRDTLERQVASRSPTAISEKSVVPPPTSQTRTRSPTRDPPPPAIAERIEPGVERGLRLLEQRHALEARTARRSHRQLARRLVE